METATHAAAAIAILSPLSVRLANSLGIEGIMIAQDWEGGPSTKKVTAHRQTG